MLNITNHQGNANQTQTEISPKPVRMAIIKKKTNNRVAEDAEKREFSWDVGATTMENSVEVARKIYPAKLQFWVLFQKAPQNTTSKRYMHPYVHSSTIYNS